MKVSDFLAETQLLFGDTTEDTPKVFLIEALNWAMREMTNTPKLSKVFAHHYNYNLAAKGHYKWDLTGDYFERISDIEYLHFWSSTGGKPCQMKVCWVEPRVLYGKTLPSAAKAGKPCYYTLETEGDKTYLVLDRPSDVPIILDYIAYGVPKPVKSLDDEVPVPSVAKNAIMDLIRVKFYQEADDLAFAGAFFDTYSNVDVPQLLQEIYKRKQSEPNYIIGG